MAICRKCGAQLPPDAQFCSRCGTPVAAAAPAVPPAPPVTPPAAAPPPARPVPPATAAPVPARVERRGGAWWIVPLVIVGLVVIAWLLLAGLPFGRDEGERVDAPAVETIAEGTAPPPAATVGQTGTIVDVTEDPPPAVATTTMVTNTAPAPVAAEPPPESVPAPAPEQRRVIEERPAPAPAPSRSPAPAPAQGREISEGEASAVLRGYITARNYYEGVSTQCVQVRGSGYRNVGYGFTVWDACASGGGSRMLGRWRVDAKTREVFRQQNDGRYLRP